MNFSVLAAFALLLTSQSATLELRFPSEFSVPTPDADFRGIARDMYRSLEQPSCSNNGFTVAKNFHRRDHLQDQFAAVKAFEARFIGTPLAAQLAFAKADAQLPHGCWADDDIRFANSHVKMTQEDVARSLKNLAELAPSLARTSPLDRSLASAAEFRDRARDAILLVRLNCTLVANARNEVVVGPARAALIDFRRRLEGTPLALQLDVADADANFDFFRGLGAFPDCGRPSRAAVAKVQAEVLENMKRKLAALQAMTPQGRPTK